MLLHTIPSYDQECVVVVHYATLFGQPAAVTEQLSQARRYHRPRKCDQSNRMGAEFRLGSA